MGESILIEIKKLLQIPSDYDVYDLDLIVAINSAFVTLNQIGVGPSSPFMIQGSRECWEMFAADARIIGLVKPYIQLKVKLMFDPPTVGFVQTSYENQVRELEWRLKVLGEAQEVDSE